METHDYREMTQQSVYHNSFFYGKHFKYLTTLQSMMKTDPKFKVTEALWLRFSHNGSTSVYTRKSHSTMYLGIGTACYESKGNTCSVPVTTLVATETQFGASSEN
jgi:hypothetical protein